MDITVHPDMSLEPDEIFTISLERGTRFDSRIILIETEKQVVIEDTDCEISLSLLPFQLSLMLTYLF